MSSIAESKTAAEKPAPGPAAARPGLFGFIWSHSRREQIGILFIVLASLPFYFASLDLPKSIVNDAIQGRAFANGRELAPVFRLHLALPSFLGGGEIVDFPGIPLSRVWYLAALSGLFLLLVLINGGFKYFINMRKGKLGERVLRSLRLDLFSQVLRLSPEAARNAKPSEVATIIKDEVEPIGGFVGDAFVQPIFLAGQALTALLFIFQQSPSLAGLTIGMVAIQGAIVPRLRREQLRLGRARQLQSRALAGRIGEVVEGLSEVANHGVGEYERKRVAGQLDQLFWVRYRLYGRKFLAKFINNLLAQITPFLFYLLGGFYALSGGLDIGQLVAVIGAYRELPPPLKELIDWDQQRQDVALKYEQVMEQFTAAAETAEGAAAPELRSGLIEAQGLRLTGAAGEALLERANLALPLGAHIALLALAGNGAGVLAQVLARRLTSYSGQLRVAGVDLAQVSPAALGQRMAYVGPETNIFQGTIRDNVLYGLRRQHGAPDDLAAITAERQGPAAPEDSVDHRAAGAESSAEVDGQIIAILSAVGMDEAVYRLGFACTIDPARQPELAGRIVAARAALKQSLIAEGAKGVIEPFALDRFNVNATIGENLLFGVARSSEFTDEKLAGHPLMRPILDVTGLTALLDAMGRKIAATMVEIFSGVSGDHYLFEQFSFIQPDDLPDYKDALARAGNASAAPDSDAALFISLSLRYVEPRHRLNLLSVDLFQRILLARQRFMATPAAELRGAVEFYDSGRFCTAAPLRDNLLFGRIAHGIAHAERRVNEAAFAVMRAQGLERDIFRLGLDHPAGHAGRLLQPADRSALMLARSLIKRPDILVLNQPFAAFGESEARAILARIRQLTAGRTLITVTRDAEAARSLDYVVEVENARVKWAGPTAQMNQEPTAAAPADAAEETGGAQDEVQALRAVPAFSNVDPARLKLIAFTSDRLTFADGDIMFKQGRPSDSAYVILSGGADVWLEKGEGRLHLAKIGKHAIIGEMGVISGAARSATVIATSETVALRLAKDVFLSLLAEFPQIALSVMRDQISRIANSQARLAAQQAGEPGP